MLSLGGVAAWPLCICIICIGFVASRWGLAITWMSTYKSVSVMSPWHKDELKRIQAVFTPFSPMCPVDSQEELAELSAQIGSGLGCLYCHLDLLCVFAMIRVGIDVVQIHVFTFAWLMLFVEVLLKWRFIWCLKVFECLSKWGLAGEPLRQVVPLRNGALGGDVEQQTRDGSGIPRMPSLGHYTKSKSLSEVLKSWWLVILVLVFACIARRISVFLYFLR